MRPTSVNLLEAQKNPISNQLHGFYIYRSRRINIHFAPSLSIARSTVLHPSTSFPLLPHPSAPPLSLQPAPPCLSSLPLSYASLSQWISRSSWPDGVVTWRPDDARFGGLAVWRPWSGRRGHVQFDGLGASSSIGRASPPLDLLHK
jgi:hypothetical protein